MTDLNSQPLTPEPPAMAEQAAIAYLQTPQAIRDRCQHLFDLAMADQLQHFRCDLSQLEATANYVLQVMRHHYPTLDVPFHSRWRHFEGGSSDRLAQLERRLAAFDPTEQSRIKFDLAIVSVLLDAGAGAEWRYVEPGTGEVYQRSEGLAVASFHQFLQGAFSSDPQQPLQVDAIALQSIAPESLGQGFQVTATNPLVGLEGRVNLLRSLGRILERNAHHPVSSPARPGFLVDQLWGQAIAQSLPANLVLQAVLQELGDIWPGRIRLAGVNLGDVWTHSALTGTMPGANLVPFHKLSQWLTYSLLEPLQDLGLTITGLDELTGLPEYRNGGLCVDLGLLQPKHEGVKGDRHSPGSEVIVEWRSLTVILLDHITAAIRQKLGLDDKTLPLVKVLQGGTWSAGRQIAAELRPGGIPPIQIDSDGTVF